MSLEQMTKWIDDLLAFGHRRPGHKAGHKTEAYLEKEFRKMGLKDTRQEKIPLQSWTESSWSLKIQSVSNKWESIPCHYIPYTAFTEKPVTAELIYAGEGKIDDIKGIDFKNKIVVVEFPFPMLDSGKLGKLALSRIDPENKLPDGPLHEATWIRPAWHVYHKAVAAGAAGFIGILTSQPGGFDSYYAPYGFKEGDGILKKPLPGFWVGREAGVELKRLAQAKRMARMELRGKIEQSHTSNILGVIPGRTKETIIIASHHDSPFEGATEDAAGVSVVLQIAKSMLEEKIQPEKTLLFMLTGGHFYGSIGSRSFIHSHPEILENTVAEIHIEHIALAAAEKNGKLVVLDQPEPAALFTPYNKKCVQLGREVLLENNLDPVFILPAEGPLGKFPPTDGGDFHLEGIPVFNYISNPVYLLVDFDKRDHIAFDRLVPTAKAFQSLVRKLDTVKKEELKTKSFFFKRIIGKFASWSTRNKIKKLHGPGVEV